MDVAFKVIVSISILALSGILLPWLKTKLKVEDYEYVKKVLDTLVEAAEEKYGDESGSGDKKTEYINRAAIKKGLWFADDDIKAAVLRLHARKSDYTTAHYTNSIVLEESDLEDDNG